VLSGVRVSSSECGLNAEYTPVSLAQIRTDKSKELGRRRDAVKLS